MTHEKRPASPPPSQRPAPRPGEGQRKGGGWQKPVKPPQQQTRPGGLPPKTGT